MKTELKVITPKQAQQWLSESNINNRRLSEKTVTLYAREISAGRWALNHQGIAFYKDGSLADGQHRLAAIVRANKDVSILVTTELEKDSYAGIDALRPRSLIDTIKIGGKAEWIDKRDSENVKMIFGVEKVGADEAILLAENIKESLLFTKMCFPKKSKGVVTALRSAFTLARYYGEDENRLIEFADMFYSGIVKSENDIAVIKLRDYLLTGDNAKNSGGSQREQSFSKVQNCIKKFCEHKTMGQLKALENLPYPKLDPKSILEAK